MYGRYGIKIKSIKHWYSHFLVVYRNYLFIKISRLAFLIGDPDDDFSCAMKLSAVL